MNIVITGATGHIGVNLCKRLLTEGHRLTALYRQEATSLTGLDIQLIQGDILDEKALEQLVKGAEVVFHLAALISVTGGQNGLVHQTNVKGPEKLAAACVRAGVRRLVHMSSVHAFRQTQTDKVLDESCPLVGKEGFAYDYSKAAGQQAVLKAAGESLEVIILNPTGVIGPNDLFPSLMGQFFLRLYHRSLPALVKGGFNFVDVRDVVDAAVAAISKGKTGCSHLLAGHYCRIPELGKLAAGITGKKAPAVSSPIWMAKMGVPFFEVYSKLTHSHPLFTFESLEALRTGSPHISTQRAESLLGFQIRPLASSVSDIYEDFARRGMLN